MTGAIFHPHPNSNHVNANTNPNPNCKPKPNHDLFTLTFWIRTGSLDKHKHATMGIGLRPLCLHLTLQCIITKCNIRFRSILQNHCRRSWPCSRNVLPH